MRKVYIDVGNTLNSPSTTGIQRVTRKFVHEVASLQKKLCYQYIPITFDSGTSRWRKLSLYEVNLIASCKPRRTNFMARANHRLKRYLGAHQALYLDKLERNSIFLDIENSWHSPLKRSKLLPALKTDGVVVVKFHYDIIPILMPDRMPSDSVSKFNSHFLSHLQQADMFLCISQTSLNDVTSYCQKQGYLCPKMGVVRLGSNHCSEDKTVTREKQSETTISQFGRYILTVGTLEPRKNHELILTAYDLIREDTDLNIVIVGQVGWLADELYSTIISHPDFGSRIHHLKHVGDEALARLYQYAWISVFPSHYEGYGLPVVEALSHACPTICSDIPALREIAEGHTRFFSSSSEQELAKLIIELDSNISSYDELVSMVKTFKPARWTDTVLDVDKQLMGM